MTARPRSESGPSLPAVPGRIPPIGARLTGLSHAGQASPAPLSIHGDRGWVEGTESRSGLRIGFDDHDVAFVSADTGAAANVLLFPGVVRRDFTGAAGMCVETTMVAPALPLVVCQWTTEGGSALPKIIVELFAPPTVETVDPEDLLRDASCVGIPTPDGLVVVGLSPAPATIAVTVGARGEGGVRVVFEPNRASTTSLVLSTGSEREVRSAFEASAHAPGHALRAAAGPEDGLLLETGVAEIDEGVQWLRSRLSGQIRRRSAMEVSDRTLTLGVAAMGAGDRDGAAHLLSRLALHATAERAALAARFSSVFGDVFHAATVARAWVDEPPSAANPLVGVAAGLLADALHHSAHPGTIARLRKLAAEGVRPAPSGGSVATSEASHPVGARALPMVGSEGLAGPAGDRIDWLSGLLSGEPTPPVPRSSRPGVTAAREASVRFSIDPDGAWAEWRRLLSRASGDGAITLWDRPSSVDAAPDDGSLTAELLIALAYGMLGLAPDAPVGRIRLAPRIPSHLTAFSARGLCVGDCVLRLDYGRAERIHRFGLVPEVASVPPLVVFEPAVHGSVLAVRVDGHDANLETRPVGRLTVVPVQVPVDGSRSVEIEVG